MALVTGITLVVFLPLGLFFAVITLLLVIGEAISSMNLNINKRGDDTGYIVTFDNKTTEREREYNLDEFSSESLEEMK